MPGRPFSDLTGAAVLAEFQRIGPAPWPARVQDFRAGGIGVAAALVLCAAEYGGPPEPGPGVEPELGMDWPLLVLVLDDVAYRVAPGLHALLTGDGWTAGSAEAPPVWAEWSVLDGLDPLAKLMVRADLPDPLAASLVLPVRPLGPALDGIARAPAVALMRDEDARRLPRTVLLPAALAAMVLVPAPPSPTLSAIARRWRHDL